MGLIWGTMANNFYLWQGLLTGRGLNYDPYSHASLGSQQNQTATALRLNLHRDNTEKDGIQTEMATPLRSTTRPGFFADSPPRSPSAKHPKTVSIRESGEGAESDGTRVSDGVREIRESGETSGARESGETREVGASTSASNHPQDQAQLPSTGPDEGQQALNPVIGELSSSEHSPNRDIGSSGAHVDRPSDVDDGSLRLPDSRRSTPDQEQGRA